MLGLIVALDVFILLGVVYLVFEVLKPKTKVTLESPKPTPSLFSKAKKIPKVHDDEYAYRKELEDRKRPI